LIFLQVLDIKQYYVALKVTAVRITSGDKVIFQLIEPLSLMISYDNIAFLLTPLLYLFTGLKKTRPGYVVLVIATVNSAGDKNCLQTSISALTFRTVHQLVMASMD